MRVAFYTLGCKANQYDTQTMIQAAERAGHEIVPFEGQADAYVINSCSVTQESERKARQMIGRVKRNHPGSHILVAGCYSQRDAAEVLSIQGVDAALGTADRSRIAEVLEGLEKGGRRDYVEDVMHRESFEEEDARPAMERARAYIKIQDGCDRFCTYCIIPYTRGAVRSRSLEGIRNEALQVRRAGKREVVLTGIRIASFGKGTPYGLADAVEAAASVPGLRVRLGSLDPDEMEEDFLKRVAGIDGFCRHFHLSLQSGCDTVLKRMGRRYTTAEYLDTVNRIRHWMPDASFTTDVMCGFCQETEEEFEQTCEFVQKVGFLKMHVFPYSKREGTAAARMGGHLPNAVKHERAEKLIQISEKMEREFLSALIGTEQEVIFEQEDESGLYQGHARNYCIVKTKANPQLRNGIYRVTIERADQKSVYGPAELLD